MRWAHRTGISVKVGFKILPAGILT